MWGGGGSVFIGGGEGSQRERGRLRAFVPALHGRLPGQQSSLVLPAVGVLLTPARSHQGAEADSVSSSLCRSTCGEDQEAVQAQKIWKKSIMLVWRAAANHR